MSTITIRLNPKAPWQIEAGTSNIEREIGFNVRVSLHGGKFAPEDLNDCLIKNPHLNVEVDIGQKTRIVAILLGGKEPDKVNNQRYVRVNVGDKVKGFFNLEEAREFSMNNPTIPVFVLNQDNNFSAITEFTLGEKDCVLRRLSELDEFIIKETSNGKIFGNHGVTEPASINNREILLAEKDIEILNVIKNHKEQVTDVVISLISSPEHVEQLYKTLVEIFEKEIPAITYKIETLEAVSRLGEILDRSEDLGLNPEIVIGCGDLEAQVRESLGKDGKKPSEENVRKRLEEKIEEVVRKLSERKTDHLSIAWGLGEDNDTTSKIRTIFRIGYKYGVRIDYWVTKATISTSNPSEVLGVLKGIIDQRDKVIQELLVGLTTEAVDDMLVE